MNEHVVVTDDLTKSYGTARVVDSVSISLEKGRIYGLIGPNGAGKTTLMRLILGLARRTRGSVSLFGSSLTDPAKQDLRRIGTLIEAPALYGSMTAQQNMHLYRLMRGIPNAGVEVELLEMVGLASANKKRVSNFSLGMRQRLGIALSLISSPELIVLDEPVNGLDPEGVVEVRTLIRDLAIQRGISVLISSHNLPELFQTATDYIIMNRGSVVRVLTLAELEAETQRYLRLDSSDTGELVRVLEEVVGTNDFSVMPDSSVRLWSNLDAPESLLRTLVANDVWPTSFVLEGESLESFFLSTVGGAE